MPASGSRDASPRPRIKEIARYEYVDPSTSAVRHVTVRFEPKTFRQGRPLPDGGFSWSLAGVELLLFGMPELAAADPAEPVLLVEGEGLVLLARQLGFVATTAPMGAGKFKAVERTARRALAGRYVVVLPDQDAVGHKHADEVIGCLARVAAKLKRLELPGLEEHGDLKDWLARGGTAAELREMIDAERELDGGAAKTASAKRSAARFAPMAGDDDVDDGQGDAASATTRLIQIGEGCDLFRAPDRRPWVTFHIDGKAESRPIDSDDFKDWLTLRYYRDEGRAPATQALSAAQSTLRAQALFDSSRTQREIFTRLAEHDGVIYLDLCNEARQVVRVSAEGWQLGDCPPEVKFRRETGMAALPVPARGGSLAELWRIVNLLPDADRVLVAAWLVAALRVRGACPFLVVNGDHGAAKSTFGRFLLDLIDPGIGLRVMPGTHRELMISAVNSWVLGYDNLSTISDETSDMMCRLVSGAAFSTRKLHSNDGEVVLRARRPILVNGITDVVTRPDLLSRSVIVNLGAIEGRRRRSEREVEAEFELARPRILGALLDAVSAALRNLPLVRVDALPRMADFAEWAVAAETALGFAPGTFERAYDDNQSVGHNIAVESSVVGEAVLALAARGPWAGTATDLLVELRHYVDDEARKDRTFPRNAQSASTHLRRVRPTLERLGVRVSFSTEDTARRRIISIRQIEAGSRDLGAAILGNGNGSEDKIAAIAKIALTPGSPAANSNGREPGEDDGDGEAGIS